MKKWKKWMTLGLAGTLLAGSLSVGAMAEEKNYQDTEFRISWWGGDTRNTQTTLMIEEFEKAYPGLHIDVEYTGWDDYWTKLNTQAAGNDLPDVIQMDYSKLNYFSEAELLLDLKSYVESGELDMSNVEASTLAAGEINGELLAIVTGMNAPAFLANTAVLEEAGVTLSQTPTLDEFLTACQTVYEKTGVKCVGYALQYLVRAEGRNMYADDGKSVGFTVDDLVKLWQISYDGRHAGYFVTPNDPLSDTAEGYLYNRESWYNTAWCNSLEAMETNTGLDLSLYALPTTGDIAPTYMKPNMFWSVTRNTEAPEVAVAFLNTFVNDTATYDRLGIDRGMPISSVIREYLKPNMSSSQQKIVDYMNVLEDGHVTPIFKPEPSKAAEAEAILYEADEEVYYDLIAPEDFPARAQQVIDQMNAVLSAE